MNCMIFYLPCTWVVAFSLCIPSILLCPYLIALAMEFYNDGIMSVSLS